VVKREVVKITEEHHVGQAQIAAKSMALSIGLSQVATHSIATAVSELANNLFFHATHGGTITISSIRQNGSIGVEIISEDEGPGIPDIGKAMRDGFTTNGGLGGGLPGTERLMDDFEIISSAKAGTRVVARKWQACE